MDFLCFDRSGYAFVALAMTTLTRVSAQTPAPATTRGLEVVQIEKQPWYEADDKAVAREIASPSNSRARELSIADIMIPAGVAVKPHYQKVTEEIYSVTGGEGVMIIDGVEQKIGVGDAVAFRPGERHSVRNESKAALRLIVTCTPAWTPDCLIFDEPPSGSRHPQAQTPQKTMSIRCFPKPNRVAIFVLSPGGVIVGTAITALATRGNFHPVDPLANLAVTASGFSLDDDAAVKEPSAPT